MTNPTAAELIARSNRLGADPKNTNYAGGNTSAKGTETDPVTGEPVELLWVKGSGGDLGTLTESGLAVLRLDRMRALVDVYPGVDREDEMVAAFDYCLHGKGGAAPSIDTAMHGLVDARARRPPAPRLGHRDRDRRRRRGAHRGRSSARRSSGCRGVAPASSSGSTSPRSRRRTRRRSAASSAGTASPRGATRRTRPRRTRCGSSRPPPAYIAEHGTTEPFGAALDGYAALPDDERRATAAALAPTIRGIASHDKPMVGHFTDDPTRARVPRERRARRASPRSARAAPTTSCAPRSSRCCSTCPPTRPVEEQLARLKELHEAYRADYQAYYDAHATAGVPRDPRRRPAHRARPGRRHVLATARTSRPPASPASSTSTRST